VAGLPVVKCFALTVSNLALFGVPGLMVGFEDKKILPEQID